MDDKLSKTQVCLFLGAIDNVNSALTELLECWKADKELEDAMFDAPDAVARAYPFQFSLDDTVANFQGWAEAVTEYLHTLTDEE